MSHLSNTISLSVKILSLPPLKVNTNPCKLTAVPRLIESIQLCSDMLLLVCVVDISKCLENVSFFEKSDAKNL